MRWPWSKTPAPPAQVLPPRVVVLRQVRSEQTSPSNREHWADAHDLSPIGALTPERRRILRRRARYEVEANSYAHGIVQTLANDLVGSGPRLQMLTPDAAFNDMVETAWERWTLNIGLAEKLRTMRIARAQDGEAFAVLSNGSAAQITLNVMLLEADYFADPDGWHTGDLADGIRYDNQTGAPESYTILKEHPADGYMIDSPARRLPARDVVHWYRANRPGQLRGIPDIYPALDLFAQLRRYTLATLDAAETAANVAGVLQTNMPGSGFAANVELGAELDIGRNSLVSIPEGWQLAQLKAEQPTTNYEMFKAEIINEIARCLNMPYNIASGNSSSYNYASGRLDHQTYYRAIGVERSHMERVVLDHIFHAWLASARITLNLAIADETHVWFWPGHEHVDPKKEADAQAMRLASYTGSLAGEYAKLGKDWEKELRQIAREKALKRDLGLNEEPAPSPEPDTEDDDG